MGARTGAEVSRKTGISKSALDRYLGGATPPADRALILASELGVRPEWLILGSGERAESELKSGDWVTLSRLDLTRIDGKSQQVERVSLRKEFLGRWGGYPGLWLAEMPSDAAPEIAREGNLLLCSDPEPELVDGRVYAFVIDGRPIVRRVQIRPEGVSLKTGDSDPNPVVIPTDQVQNLRRVARILAAISLQPV